MAVKTQQLRSSTASKRPTASALLDGELALNLDAGTPGLFFENGSAGIVKVGPCEVSGTAPNAAPAAGARRGHRLVSGGAACLGRPLTDVRTDGADLHGDGETRGYGEVPRTCDGSGYNGRRRACGHLLLPRPGSRGTREPGIGGRLLRSRFFARHQFRRRVRATSGTSLERGEDERCRNPA